MLSLALIAGRGFGDAPPAKAKPVATSAAGSPLTVASNLMVEQDVAVTTRVSGVIESIQADRGATVQKGQPLATLDQREFELDRRAAEESLNLSLADYKRYQDLSKLGLASQAELEQRKARFELARVELERAKLIIDRSIIRAPFDGVVVDRFVRAGQKVLVSENSPIFKVMALEPLLARAYLPEPAARRVRVGEEVSIRAVEFPDLRSTGWVVFRSPVIDPASGTLQVMVRVRPDREKALRPGMAVQISFGASSGSHPLAVPAAPR